MYKNFIYVLKLLNCSHSKKKMFNVKGDDYEFTNKQFLVPKSNSPI